MENKNKLSAYIDTVWLALGEIIVAALISAVYLMLKRFDYTVITGAALGGAVTVINFLILSVGVNRAINKFVLFVLIDRRNYILLILICVTHISPSLQLKYFY